MARPKIVLRLGAVSKSSVPEIRMTQRPKKLLDQAGTRHHAAQGPDRGNIEFGGQEGRGHRRYPRDRPVRTPLSDLSPA